MLSRFFDIRPGEVYRVGVIASLLFLLIAAPVAGHIDIVQMRVGEPLLWARRI